MINWPVTEVNGRYPRVGPPAPSPVWVPPGSAWPPLLPGPASAPQDVRQRPPLCCSPLRTSGFAPHPGEVRPWHSLHRVLGMGAAATPGPRCAWRRLSGALASPCHPKRQSSIPYKYGGAVNTQQGTPLSKARRSGREPGEESPSPPSSGRLVWEAGALRSLWGQPACHSSQPGGAPLTAVSCLPGAALCSEGLVWSSAFSRGGRLITAASFSVAGAC